MKASEAIDVARSEDAAVVERRLIATDGQRWHESFVKDDVTLQQSLPVVKLLLTVPEVGRVLAISRSKVYELLNSGSLASVSIGRSRRIRVSDVEAFVHGGGREY